MTKLHPDTLASAISSEIARVSAKRERELRAAQAQDAVGEARVDLYLMDRAIHFAREARDDGEPIEMAITLSALRDIGD